MDSLFKKMNSTRLFRSILIGCMSGSLLATFLSGNGCSRYMSKKVWGHKNEYRLDEDGDGKMEKIILTNDKGDGLIYERTGLPFPAYIHTGWVWNYNNNENE